MLDVRHFHVVFTLPSELRPLARFAPRVVFEALIHAAQRTLLEFGKSRLKATVGATLILHTWTRKLELHPHVHAIVTAGGLSPDAVSWRAASRRFLFSVDAMGRVFRGKMMTALGRAYDDGAFAKLHHIHDPQAFAALMGRLPKRWNVYAKATFKKGQHVLSYLGRYTHRVGIANSRLLAVSDVAISFRTKGTATETLAPVVFLRRFVQHVLPDGLHKIRHVGLLRPRVRRPTRARTSAPRPRYAQPPAAQLARTTRLPPPVAISPPAHGAADDSSPSTSHAPVTHRSPHDALAAPIPQPARHVVAARASRS